MHRSLIYSSIRWSRSILYDVCFSRVMRFLCELSPRATKYELNWPAISLLGGELALPISGWPASAALRGNSDTTAKPSGWQVYFRGTYKTLLHCKSVFMLPALRYSQPKKLKRLLQAEQPSGVLDCHWPPESSAGG